MEDPNMKHIKVLGIDLAKMFFNYMVQMEKEMFYVKNYREKLIEFIAQITPCIIGIEACMSSHYWARIFEKWVIQ